MILTTEQLETICTMGPDGPSYECILAKQKFAHALLKEQMIPLGNIITFVAPTKIGPLFIDKALVFCAELLKIDTFGAACFQRLFSAQLGTLLSDICQKEFFIEENSIFTETDQCSVALVNKVKEDALFHIILPIDTNQPNVHRLELTEEQIKDFQTKAMDCFYDLTRSIFLETQSDNI